MIADEALAKKGQRVLEDKTKAVIARCMQLTTRMRMRRVTRLLRSGSTLQPNAANRSFWYTLHKTLMGFAGCGYGDRPGRPAPDPSARAALCVQARSSAAGGGGRTRRQSNVCPTLR